MECGSFGFRAFRVWAAAGTICGTRLVTLDFGRLRGNPGTLIVLN